MTKAGRYRVRLEALNSFGKTHRTLIISAQKGKVALTPPMGWNSWNVWAGAIDGQKVKDAADTMVSSGLASHGFQYVNIDDCWEDILSIGIITVHGCVPSRYGLTKRMEESD